MPRFLILDSFDMSLENGTCVPACQNRCSEAGLIAVDAKGGADMWARFGVVVALLAGINAGVPGPAQVAALAQDPGESGSASPKLESVIGQVTATEGKQITVKLDAGRIVIVSLQETTLYLRVPPGETDLKKAVKIAPGDIGVGDRVYARGRLAEDQKSMPALAVIVMTKADLAQKRERERADWQKRGVAGTISALNPAANEITLSVRSREGTKTAIVESSQKTIFRRYAPDSVQFAQAKPSSFAELKVGDALRILGDKNSDGTRIKPEEIVSGSFRNIVGIVSAIDAAAREIRVTDLQAKRSLVVRIAADSVLRRMPQAKAATTTNSPPAGGRGAASGGRSGEAPAQGARSEAASSRPAEDGRGTTAGGRSGEAPAQGPRSEAASSRPAEGGRGAATGGRSGEAPTQGARSEAAPNRPAEGGRGAAPGGRSAGTPAGGGAQLDVERMPVLSLGDLKREEAILVLCTVGEEPSRVTAIVLVAGVESLLAPGPDGQAQVGGLWNFFDISLP
jgi:hypothetical protein